VELPRQPRIVTNEFVERLGLDDLLQLLIVLGDFEIVHVFGDVKHGTVLLYVSDCV
jgi:hypothetical protein